MANSYARIVLHTVFSTKYRACSITPDLEDPVKRLLTYHLRKLGSSVVEINCVVDHVHIIHTLPRTVTISKLVQEAKKWTTKTINEELRPAVPFCFQIGYASFSVNYTNMESLIKYVQIQKMHHGYDTNERGESFMEEYTRQLLIHGFEPHPIYTFSGTPTGNKQLPIDPIPGNQHPNTTIPLQ